MSTPQVILTNPSNQVNNQVSTPLPAATEETSSVKSIIVYGVVIIAVLLLIYYAYTKFVENSEGPVDSEEKSQDEPVSDYVLADAIEELQSMQKSILKNLTQDTGI